MAKPTLLIIIEQGPKSGHCLKCKPSGRSTIGRARANTLQISKDSGISQKHLAFFWVPACDEDDGGWFVTDLGSSNGTLLNDLQIEPNCPISIKPADLIKIGAETTIRVDIPSPEICNATKCKGVSEHADSNSKGISVLEETRAHSCPAVQNCDKLAPLPEENCGKCAPVPEKEHDHPLPEKDHSKHLPPEENHYKHVPASIEHRRVGVSKERGRQEPERDACKSSAHGIDLSMTVEQWFMHLKEEGPKYLHRVSESVIQDILLESKQFDEYILSL